MRRLACLLAAALVAPVTASAWSDPGHRIVAAVAEERLTPAARRLVREIVGSKPLSDHEIATWADDVRDRRTGPWHYVNVPFTAEGYVAARDCPRAGCVVSALEGAVRTLTDGDNAADLADSLRWLVHLVGDVHQPMHAGELRDRGGNDTEVRIGRRRQPLSVHRLWDVVVVAPLIEGSDPHRVAQALTEALRPADVAAWSAELSPAAWATESHLLARALYRELGTLPAEGDVILLPQDYGRAQRARTQELLSKAGVRLAAVLNRIAAQREARGQSR
ncbi:MAG: S1/P1 nuclease [Anaeromyxobacteraceae bacterium]